MYNNMHDGTCTAYLSCRMVGWQGGSPVREYGGSDDDSDGEDGARQRTRRRIGEDEQSGTINTDRHQNTLDTLRPTSTALRRTETLAYPGTDQTLSQIPATVSKTHALSRIVVARPLKKLSPFTAGCVRVAQLETSDSPGGAMGPPPPAFARGGVGGSTSSGSRPHRSSDPSRDLLDDM